MGNESTTTRLLLCLSLLVSAFGAKADLLKREMISRLSVQDETEIFVSKKLKSTLKYKGAYLIQTKDAEVPKLKLLTYDKNEMKLKTFKASTRLPTGEVIPVPASMIRQLAQSEEAGFSSNISLEVAFPKMNVGSVVAWEYEIEETQVPLQGFFSHLLRLDGEFHASEGYKFSIVSQVPLQFVKNNPGELLKIKSSTLKNGQQKINVSLARDLNQAVVNESYGYLSLNRYPSLIFSSAKDWKSVGVALNKIYQERLKEPLPNFMKVILTEVKKQNGFLTQTETLHRLLRNQIRYMGDWRGRFSAQVPRTMAQIAESQFGDCKDFSLLMVRALRELNYPAQFASIFADRIPVPDFYYKLPLNYFNHQIVSVKTGGRQYWIDPTSLEEQSFIDDNLVNRMALVWDTKPRVQKIEAYKSQENGFWYRLVMNPKGGGQYLGDLEIESWGLESKFSRVDTTSATAMTKWLTPFFPDIKAFQQNMSPFSPSRGRAWGQKYRGLGHFENVFDKSPLGEGFKVGFSGVLRAILDVNASWKSDFDFGYPSSKVYDIYIKDRNFMGTTQPTCQIHSPWMDLSLSTQNQGYAARVTYTETLKVPEISNQQLFSAEFKQLQKQIGDCLVGQILILGQPQAVGLAQSGGGANGQKRSMASVGDPMGLSLVRTGAATRMKVPSKAMRPMAFALASNSGESSVARPSNKAVIVVKKTASKQKKSKRTVASKQKRNKVYAKRPAAAVKWFVPKAEPSAPTSVVE
jgi:hypothetical protein